MSVEPPGVERGLQVGEEERSSFLSQPDFSPEKLARLVGLEGFLKAHIIGQDDVLPTISEFVVNGALGFTEAREPRSAFLFLGPTGVGKTETVLKFTDYLFGENKLIELNMSEFMNKEAVGVLLGTKPGERGILGEYYDRAGGEGTLLFDEIEKADRAVQDLFLQVLDGARITLANGETLDLTKFYVTATSNIGASLLMNTRARNRETLVRRVETEAKAMMRPEIFARFNPVLVFNRLEYDQLVEIAKVHLGKVLKHMAERGHVLSYDTSILGPIIERGYTEELGARPMRNAARGAIRDAVRKALLGGDPGNGTVHYTRQEGFHLRALGT